MLVLTPACDLVRCEMSTQVLCVLGVAQEKSDIKAQTLEKLYGKHETKVRHLLKPEGRSPELITWQKGQTVMLPVWRLQKEFQRVAQMNEFYAQEVKEEVLREIGRIGILKKGGVFTSSEFALKFVEDLTAGSSPENSVWIDITLSP